MGSVLFNTDVDKTVDINKNVNLDVNKDVDADVDISGQLATAEASADAVGAGVGEACTTRNFTMDDFEDAQLVVAEPLSDAAGLAPGSIIPPDGATFNATDIAGGGLRTIKVDNYTDAGDAQASINPGGSGEARLSNDDNQATNSNQQVEYQNRESSPYSVLVDCQPPSEIDFTDAVANQLVFEDVEFLFTENTGTLRFSVTLIDANFNLAVFGAYAASPQFAIDNGVNQFVNGQDIAIPLGLFTGDIDAPAVDTELDIFGPGSNVGFYTAGLVFPGGGEIDLDQISSLSFSLLSDPEAFTLPQTPLEDPTGGGWNVNVDAFKVNSECCTPDDRANGGLAETDTFAQATDEGAFSFSEALAAVSSDTDTVIA